MEGKDSRAYLAIRLISVKGIARRAVRIVEYGIPFIMMLAEYQEL
jgi:hypothetical protein